MSKCINFSNGTIPNSMWITLLNLSGESPLAHYTAWGKILQVPLGLFATGFFGIPIGILGAGFQDWAEENNEDTPDEGGSMDEERRVPHSELSTLVDVSLDNMNHSAFSWGLASHSSTLEALLRNS